MSQKKTDWPSFFILTHLSYLIFHTSSAEILSAPALMLRDASLNTLAGAEQGDGHGIRPRFGVKLRTNAQ